MWSSLSVLVVGALLCAGAGFWVLRAYRLAGGGSRSAAPAIVSCVLVAVAALAVYLVIGRPELPDAPYKERLAAIEARDPATRNGEEWLAVFHEAARANPDNPLPYLYRGDILLRQGRAQEAARAFDAALRREPRLSEAMMGLAFSIIEIEGRITPEALALFQQASTLTDDPRPWLYQAIAAMEDGREADARRLWRETYNRLPPDDPRREMALRMSRGAGR